MPKYTGFRSGITPVVTADNWTLNAPTASTGGQIIEVHWGGEVTTSTAMRSKIVRPTTAGVTPTNGTLGQTHPFSAAAVVTLVTTWATQPALPAAGVGELFAESWNAHGGVIRWLAAPGEELVCINGVLTGSISCRNDVGVATSSYGFIVDQY